MTASKLSADERRAWGGSWFFPSREAVYPCKDPNAPGFRYEDLGARLVRRIP